MSVLLRRLILLLFVLFSCCCNVVQAYPTTNTGGSSRSKNLGKSFLTPSRSSSSGSVELEAVLKLVEEARRMGPVANGCSDEEKTNILQQARSLLDGSYSTPPAHVNLTGVHERLYSTSPGKKRGRIQQRFLNATYLENTVGFGPFQAVATATVTPINDTTSNIEFHNLSYRLCGFNFPWGQKSFNGYKGTWKFLYVGVIIDPIDGKRKLLRVMETPSLFMLLQDLE